MLILSACAYLSGDAIFSSIDAKCKSRIHRKKDGSPLAYFTAEVAVCLLFLSDTEKKLSVYLMSLKLIARSKTNTVQHDKLSFFTCVPSNFGDFTNFIEFRLNVYFH